MSEKFNRTDFLEAIFGTHSEETGSFVLIQTVDDSGSRLSNHFYPNIRQLSIAEFLPNRSVYFGVCPRQRMTLSGEHIRFATTLWAGIDVGPGGYSGLNSHFADRMEARKAIESFPISPSIIVQSGRGFHLYWLFDSPKEITNVEIVEGLLRKLNSHFRCASAVGVDSALRLPGTWNARGYRTSVKCFVEHLDSGLRYHPRDFQDLERLVIAVPGTASQMVVEPEAAPVSPVAPSIISAKDDAPSSRETATHSEMPAAATEVPGEPEETGEASPGRNDHEGPALGLTDEALDVLADHIAERVSHSFLKNHADLIVEKVVDKIVGKLVERIWLEEDR